MRDFLRCGALECSLRAAAMDGSADGRPAHVQAFREFRLENPGPGERPTVYDQFPYLTNAGKQVVPCSAVYPGLAAL